MPQKPRPHPRLLPSPKCLLNQHAQKFEQIPSERKAKLAGVSGYFRQKVGFNLPANLNFICNHNSHRRRLVRNPRGGKLFLRHRGKGVQPPGGHRLPDLRPSGRYRKSRRQQPRLPSELLRGRAAPELYFQVARPPPQPDQQLLCGDHLLSCRSRLPHRPASTCVSPSVKRIPSGRMKDRERRPAPQSAQARFAKRRCAS